AHHGLTTGPKRKPTTPRRAIRHSHTQQRDSAKYRKQVRAGFRRLRIRWEIRDDIHEAFLSLACSIICWRRLRNLTPC
ncbi:hypothetical protein ACWCQD_45120, partial [Streptomyces atratus]